MSADIVVFHSSEADDPASLVEGWYVGTVEGYGIREAANEN